MYYRVYEGFALTLFLYIGHYSDGIAGWYLSPLSIPKLNTPNFYWLTSLATSAIALAIFGGGIIVIEDISRPEFNFTIGNALFI